MKMPLFLTAIILSLISVSCSEENQLTEPLRETIINFIIPN